jgi:hypothetical protein
MMKSLTAPERLSYYRAALGGLQFVEQRKPTGRRFGRDADARWSQFQGELTTADRIDLLLRDADTEWPGAFGARTVFGLRGVAEDEAFGADWEPLDPVDAEELWRGLPNAPLQTGDVLNHCAEAWGMARLRPIPAQATPTDKLIAAGPSAVSSLVSVFHEGADLDWADQVVVVATPPGHRQLAALATALLGLPKAGFIVHATDEVSEPAGGWRLLLSDDAAPDDATRARQLVEGA